jgi:hypothetical protein
LATPSSRAAIDAVAHQIAVALLDHVADMDADAKLYPPVLRHACIALDQAVLHLDRATHRIDHAAEFDYASVPGAFDDPAVMGGGGWIDQIAAKTAQACKRAILVGSCEPRVTDDIRDQDRRELSGLAHCVPPAIFTTI